MIFVIVRVRIVVCGSFLFLLVMWFIVFGIWMLINIYNELLIRNVVMF